ncbi:7015_t:CDS:2 [Paraglomus occultum]|uniref:histone acetyltransferase n=1 Tax=Paraglomus occultum TaxID=144539 RepID=A0A9N9A185_9GLOM|nr:7015_t:CDS:2 [Paraglomus occultum]
MESKQDSLRKSEEIEFLNIYNDRKSESLILLTSVKNLFFIQLPNMPKTYITRVVYDFNHRSMIVKKKSSTTKVLGAITYRPFLERKFAEIVFCAVDSDEQVKGYGSRLMNQFKDYITTHSDITHFLTYADDLAIGFFKRNGFSTEITLEYSIWAKHIKDYTGGTLMQCRLIPRVKYVEARQTLESQRLAVKDKLKEKYATITKQSGLKFSKSDGKYDPLSIPGVKEAGWTPEMEMRARKTICLPHYRTMVTVLEALKEQNCAWPFREPVDAKIVSDYYDVIKQPMDLSTLEKNLKNDKYQTIKQFADDVQKIFDNCRIYNAKNTLYYAAADELEGFFRNKMHEEGVRL